MPERKVYNSEFQHLVQFIIQGLQSKPELNGLSCEQKEVLESGRIVVLVHSTGASLSVKPEHLRSAQGMEAIHQDWLVVYKPPPPTEKVELTEAEQTVCADCFQLSTLSKGAFDEKGRY